MMSHCTTALICFIVLMLWFFAEFNTISFFNFTYTIHYEDLEERVTELSHHCIGKDCAVISEPLKEQCNITGVTNCYHIYSIPYNIKTYWISK